MWWIFTRLERFEIALSLPANRALIIFLFSAKQIEYAMERYGWDPEDGPIDANFSEFEMGLTVEEQDIFPELQTNRILNFIAFDKENHLPFASGCTFLRCYDPNGYRLPINKRSLREHPIASRCLGAFPSVTRLSIHYSSSTHCEPELIHNPNGIRVMDIVHKIQIKFVNILPPSASVCYIFANLVMQFGFLAYCKRTMRAT